MIVCTTFHGNFSKSCLDTSVKTKVVSHQTNSIIPGAMPLTKNIWIPKGISHFCDDEMCQDATGVLTCVKHASPFDWWWLVAHIKRKQWMTQMQQSFLDRIKPRMLRLHDLCHTPLDYKDIPDWFCQHYPLSPEQCSRTPSLFFFQLGDQTHSVVSSGKCSHTSQLDWRSCEWEVDGSNLSTTKLSHSLSGND